MAAMGHWVHRARVLLGSPSEAQIKEESLADHVAHAVRTFSTDRPRVAYGDFAGDGSSFDLDLVVLTSWVAGFSYIVAVEYPQGERTPQYLDPAEVTLVPTSAAATHVRLLVTTPASGQTARVFHAAPWPVPGDDPATDLISEVDFEPVVSLAAAGGALELAARAAGLSTPTLPAADSVDWSGEAGRWAETYRLLKRAYDDHVGGEAVGPASAVTDWDSRSAVYGQDWRYLLRGRR